MASCDIRLYTFLFGYPAEAITDADDADDLALLANTHAQFKSRLHSLEQATGDIGLRVNANKTEYRCFKQEEGISTLSVRPLKLVDKFKYLGSNISSTESDVNIRLATAWTAIKRLSVMWKPDLYDEIKRDFFSSETVSILVYGWTIWVLTHSESNTPQSSSCTATYLLSQKLTDPHLVLRIKLVGFSLTHSHYHRAFSVDWTLNNNNICEVSLPAESDL